MKTQSDIRKELDTVDEEIVRLFEKRMNLSMQMAAWKKAQGLPVLDKQREQQVIVSRRDMLTDSRYAPCVETLYETILSLSREEQNRWLQEEEHHA